MVPGTVGRLAVGDLAHRLAQDLARAGLGQRRDDVDLAQGRDRADLVAHPLHELLADPVAVGPGRRRRALSTTSPRGTWPLRVVGDADDRALGDVRVAGERRLDRRRSRAGGRRR